MSLLVESIWINGRTVMNAAYHQQRYVLSMLQLYRDAHPVDLLDLIDVNQCSTPETKCRITYARKIHKVEFIPYQRKSINSARIIKDEKVSYPLKYEDRPQLDKLYQQRNESDEIVIVKNGLVTDAYYYNLVFENGTGLYTPDQPLLAGTMRQKLLDLKVIVPIEIEIEEIYKFKKLHFINALNPLGCQSIPIGNLL